MIQGVSGHAGTIIMAVVGGISLGIFIGYVLAQGYNKKSSALVIDRNSQGQIVALIEK